MKPSRSGISAERAHERAEAQTENARGRRLDPQGLADHVGPLYRAAYGLCGSPQDAEDLVQDTYEQVLRRPRFLRHDGDLGYLMRVLHNTWVSSLRKQRPILSGSAQEEMERFPDPRGDPTGHALEAQAVYEALAQLTPQLRETVVAVDLLGLSYKDAARALRTNEGTIMSRLHRGRGQIADMLGLEE